MPGRHRDAITRPYLAVALLAGLLAVAGAGAALRPVTLALGPSAGGGTAGAVTAPSIAVGPSGGAAPAGTPSPAAPPSSAPPTTTAPNPAASPSRAASRTEQMENDVLAMVNTERARAEKPCAAVHLDTRLRTAARGHSTDMAQRNYFAHNTPEGKTPWDWAREAGYRNAIGENIAYGYRTAADVMRGWMNSPGHKANILNCAAKALGVGLAYNATGTPYWTQLFGSV